MLIYGIILIKATNDEVNRMRRDKDYLSVKDVAEILDTEAYVLRFYEKELNLDIKRNSKGYRVYALEDVEMFRKIQDMRGKGLQLKAIEALVHQKDHEEVEETYEQLSSIAVPNHAITPIRNNEVNKVDITSGEDEKVKQFTYLMKETIKQALIENSEETNKKIEEKIKQEVEAAVDERITALENLHATKDETYYKKLDEAMREVQKMRKELFEENESSQKVSKKEKTSFWNKLFKDKNQIAQL